MKFFIIMNVNSELVNGVILESSEGKYGARLAGDKGADDPHRVIPALLKRMPPDGFPMETRDGGQTKVVRYRPGQPNFMMAFLTRHLPPPLLLKQWGEIPPARMDTPDRLTEDLWNMYSDADSPEYMTL